MDLKFTFLSLDDPYKSEKTGFNYYSFNGLLDLGLGARLCNIECEEKAYNELKSAKPTTQFNGQFDVKPSFGRKRPEVRLMAISK